MSDGERAAAARRYGRRASCPPARRSRRRREPAPQPPARFQPVNRQQMVWRAVDVEQLLEPDHLARAIWEMTGRLDLTRLHRRGAGGGRPGGAFAHRSAPADQLCGFTPTAKR